MSSLLIDIACSGHFRLSVYMWDIFLTYIRRRLSSRLYFSVFWKAGCDRIFWVFMWLADTFFLRSTVMKLLTAQISCMNICLRLFSTPTCQVVWVTRSRLLYTFWMRIQKILEYFKMDLLWWIFLWKKYTQSSWKHLKKVSLPAPWNQKEVYPHLFQLTSE